MCDNSYVIDEIFRDIQFFISVIFLFFFFFLRKGDKILYLKCKSRANILDKYTIQNEF